MFLRWLIATVALVAAGCGGPRFAPVSGKVTLDDKPLVGAMVSFYPLVDNPTPETAPTSTGKTDANGQFTLEASRSATQPGAMVGRHRVSVTLLTADEGDAPAKVIKRGGPAFYEKVPLKYQGEKSELTFEVPSGGTTEANFPLKSK